MRAEAEALRAAGRTYAAIARALGPEISEDTVARHFHAGHDGRAALSDTASAHPSQIQELLTECDRLSAMAADDVRGSIQLLAQRIRLLEVAARTPQAPPMGEGAGWVKIENSIPFWDAVIEVSNQLGIPPQGQVPVGADHEKGKNALGEVPRWVLVGSPEFHAARDAYANLERSEETEETDVIAN
jgi:hypothetical protein